MPPNKRTQAGMCVRSIGLSLCMYVCNIIEKTKTTTAGTSQMERDPGHVCMSCAVPRTAIQRVDIERVLCSFK